MENTYTSIEEMLTSNNYSLGYGRYQEMELKVPFHEFGFIKPGGSICSSANDMGKYLITWLNQGKFQNKQIIPEEYIKNAIEIKNILPQHQATTEDFLIGYGYGWFVRSSKGKYLVEHGGGTSGFTSLLTMYPNEKIGIITITNQHNSGLAYYIKDIIINRIFDSKRKEIEEYPIDMAEIYQIPEEVGINEENTPTIDIKDFAGIYSNDGYGEIRIEHRKGKLLAHFPTYIIRLDHLQRNSFIMQGTTENSQFFVPTFTMNFNVDNEAKINFLSLPFHADLVEFIKVE